MLTKVQRLFVFSLAVSKSLVVRILSLKVDQTAQSVEADWLLDRMR
jgi:hypothetical protein